MNKKYTRILSLLLTLCMVLTIAPVTFAAEGDIVVTTIEKYGNIDLSITGPDFLALGYTYGDIITATVNGNDFDMPVGGNYSDVDTGSMICRVTDACVIIAINMGDFATTTGIATKTTFEDRTYEWNYNEGVETPVKVTFAMKEAGGYRDEYLIRQLTRTNNREDYADLNDSQFANFRQVTTSGVGEATLYRSSSPVNPEIARDSYAMAAMRGAAVKTVMNLADDQTSAEAREGYADSYYAQQNVIFLGLGVDFAAESFKSGLADGMRYFASHEGPYLVHCNEGKDRAGFVSAILECLMGASADEVVADYMVTYYNYYGVLPETEQYTAIANSNIRKSLATAFGIAAIDEADLAAEAAEYLAEIGLTEDEIAALKTNLSADNGLYVIPDGNDMLKYGHLDVAISTADFTQRFNYGDVVTVSVNGHRFDAPVCTDYTDVKSGAKLVRAANGKSYIILAINYGQLSVEAGVAHAEGTGYALNDDVTLPLAVRFELNSIGGYYTQWQSHHLERTNNREDYADLTDEQFANFRVCSTSGLFPNTLYRSTSPISDELGRNTYADAAARAAGIENFVNLSDSEDVAKAYVGYEGSYYSTQDTLYLDLPVSFTSDAFKAGLADAFRYIGSHRGPYLVHCLEGKDRTGMAIALLELFAGASYEEMLADYMTTYYNFYGVTEDDPAYDVILEDNIIANLKIMLDVEDLEEVDLYSEVVDYLYEIGLTNDELLDLQLHLCTSNGPVELPFTDTPDEWYQEGVEYVYAAHIMSGVAPTTFAPKRPMTRGMLVTTLWRLQGEPTGYECSFTDVAEDTYYTAAVAWAEANNIVNGVGNGLFKPNANVTREQMATILYRFVTFCEFNTPTFAELSRFADADQVQPYAKEAMAWAVSYEMIQGTNPTTLAPRAETNRAQVAMMLLRLLRCYPLEKDFLYGELTTDTLFTYSRYDVFQTGKVEYTIQGKMVSEETEVYNQLEDVHYTAQPNGIDVILKGTAGEEWVTKLSKVLTTYTKPDGSELTEADFLPDTFIDLKTKSSTGYYAMFIPVKLKVTVKTSWGDVLHANRDGIPHGAGDYLVMSTNEDGEPNFHDIWIVNGEIFPNTYDMTYADN